MIHSRYRWSRLVVAIILLGYMGLIFYLSTIPGQEIHVQTPDYILHALAFGGLSFLLTLFFLYDFSLPRSMFFSLLITFLYGLSDEAHQYFVPGRFSDWRDIAADLVGAVIVQLGLFILIRLFDYMKRQGSSNPG